MNLKHSSLLLSYACWGLLIGLASQVSAAERLASGQYEFAMTTDGATRKVNQCITAAKAAEVNGDSAAGRALAEKAANGRCKVDEYEAVGNKVSYTLTCGDHVI